ncbi:MAG: hypothetical protein RLZZ105_561, partial [Actinomycetota bacterium]
LAGIASRENQNNAQSRVAWCAEVGDLRLVYGSQSFSSRTDDESACLAR